jgi:glycerophosphoryl diester phosphodiesterase
MNLNYPVIVLGNGLGDKKTPSYSLKAFLQDIDYGADGININLKKLKDNSLIVWDQDYIDYNDEKKFLKEIDFKEISKIKVQKQNRFVSLEQLFIKMPENILFNINVEEDYLEYVIMLIKSFNAQNRVMVSVFDADLIDKINSIDEEIFIGLNYSTEIRTQDLMNKKLYSLNIDFNKYKQNIEKIKDQSSFIKEINIKVMINNLIDENYIKNLKGYYDFFSTKNVEKSVEILSNIY